MVEKVVGNEQNVSKAKLNPDNFREGRIILFNRAGDKRLYEYEGKMYVYYGDMENGIHFIDHAGKHHRFYGLPVIVEDI